MNYYSKFKRYYGIYKESRAHKTENAPVWVLLARLLFWKVFRHGSIVDFFLIHLDRKGIRIKEYITDHEFLAIHHKLNPRYYISILEDKFVFDRFLSSFGFPLAEMVGWIENGIITWIPKVKKEPLENLVALSLDCYCKYHTGWGGSKVFHLTIGAGQIKINDKISSIEELKSLTREGIFVLQKTLVQHPEMSRLNGSCVNTLRLITVHDGKDISLYGSFIRIGIGNSHVDNLSSGNIACGIHDDGTLFEVATDAYLKYMGLTHHPETRVKFSTFRIPFYQEAIELTKNMHRAFHCFFIIGWDIAITDSGPVAIEGNPLSSIGLEQLFMGGERRRFLRFAESYMNNRKLISS